MSGVVGGVAGSFGARFYNVGWAFTIPSRSDVG